MSSDSSAWTKVGKGGRPVAFPPEAASAFGGRNTREPRRERTEFPAEAASAFGRGGRRPELRSEPQYERPVRSEFDSDAAAAFGSRPRRSGGGASEFDSAASAAFGGGGSRPSRRDDDGGFPSAFGKKKSVFSEAAAMGFADGEGGGGGYALSALARKRAEAAKPPPPKPQTFEEMFPVLGAPAAASAWSGSGTAAAPVKRSFADLMRNHVAAEEAEAARVAAEEAEEAKRRYHEEIERAHIRRLHVGRHITGRGGAEFVESHDAEEVEYGGHDLDHDAYGAAHAGLDMRPVPAAEASESDEEADADEGTYNDNIY
jgi:hypothetical protein